MLPSTPHLTDPLAFDPLVGPLASGSGRGRRVAEYVSSLRALADPEQIKEYRFGSLVETGWKPGS